MLDRRTSGVGRRGVVEKPLGIDAVVAVRETHLSKDVVNVPTAMLVDQRDSHIVLVLKGSRKDGATIRTRDVVLGSPPLEIRHLALRGHQKRLPPHLEFVARPRQSD